MFKRSGAWRVLLWLAAVVLSTTTAARAGPERPLFVTSATEHGGKSEVLVLQGDSVVRSWTTRHGKELGIAVVGTVRTLGQLNTDVGAEYTFDGTPTGADYPSSFPPTPLVQFLDGTTDGVHNYAFDFTNGDAYRFDRDWSNPVKLFSLDPSAGRIGISYDGTNNSLWLAGTDGRIEDHAMDGKLLSSFGTNHSARALALDAITSTLWVQDGLNVLRFDQYTKTGVLLGGTAFTGLATKNPLGGEFPFVLMGDADQNGRVDFPDLLSLAQHYGQPAGATYAAGDFNGDGGVAFDDLLLLAQHYGQALPTAGVAAAPEPAAGCLVALIIAGLPRRRRRLSFTSPYRSPG